MSDNAKRPPLSHASGAPVTDNVNIRPQDRGGRSYCETFG